MKSLYIPMTEKLIAHWRANGNAYPQKFILTPEQHTVYVETRKKGSAARRSTGTSTWACAWKFLTARRAS